MAIKNCTICLHCFNLQGARRLKLKNLKEYSELSGGRAIELAARKAENPFRFQFTIPLIQRKDCNFSMAGIKTQLVNFILKEEKLHGKNLIITLKDYIY